MIDYISITTSFEGKDNIFLTHLQGVAFYNSGWNKYTLQKNRELTIWINFALSMLRLEGSIPYYWQGHNFTFTIKDFVDAIEDIQGLLKIDLWKATVNAVEYGIIIQVPMKPKEYIMHHDSEPKEKLNSDEKSKDKGNFRWWSDKNVKLKMYDAGRNIQMKQGLTRKNILNSLGWNAEDNFLKWEAHYIKPQYLNKGMGLQLYQLKSSDWEKTFKEDLYLQYKRLIPRKCTITPRDKKNLSTADILALTLSEVSINKGHSLELVKNMLYAKINSIPNEVLTKSDKDSRKTQVRNLFSNIKEAPKSIYDLSQNIQDALNLEQ
jgi:hypothetical protein